MAELQQAGQAPPVRPRREVLTIQGGTIGVRGKLVYQITEIKPGAPAERAGLKPNDLVLAINDHQIQNIDDVRTTIIDPIGAPGREFTIQFARLNPRTQKYESSTVRVRSE
jgi:membrane-associated protease RseP (regulator of RpoE activity)